MDLWNDPNLTFSKLVVNWLFSFDTRIRSTGFSKALVDAFSSAEDKIDAEEIRETLENNRIVPDAYIVDKEEQSVYLFEIEDTHLLTPEKLKRLCSIWFHLDCLSWTMRVFLIDRYMANWRVLPLHEVWNTLGFEDATKNGRARMLNQRSETVDWEATYQKLLASSFEAPEYGGD